jgi:YD repeat-containing protein
MKVKYDQEADILLIVLTDSPIHESDESKPGIIMDYDREGNLVRIEMLDASKRTNTPSKLEYEMVSGG